MSVSCVAVALFTLKHSSLSGISLTSDGANGGGPKLVGLVISWCGWLVDMPPPTDVCG